jgi:hypothetical protein
MGLLGSSCVVVSDDPVRVRVHLDTRVHRFLRDHLVDARPLLSTVMGVETIASAVQLVNPGASIQSVSDIVVGPPYLLGSDGRGHVDVEIEGGGNLRCVLSSAPDVVHFTATVALGTPLAAPAPRLAPRRSATDPTIDSEAVYELFFHGPSFRVVDTAHFTDGTMVGHLAPDLPPIVGIDVRSDTAPLLTELCMQTSGLWELAVLGRMMIPDGIDRVIRCTATDSRDDVPLSAIVRPRATEGGRYVFDAVVVDGSGAAHLQVVGYRTTDFAHPVDTAAIAVIRERLRGI